MNKTPALEIHEIRKVFRQGGTEVRVLDGITLTLNPGETVALLGASGSGKSTLLQVTGLLEKPTSGDIRIEGNQAWRMSDEHRSILRQNSIGFVYQSHHLLPEFTALENVMMPLLIRGVSVAKARAQGLDYLKRLHLTERASHRPSKLSGGEQQRVAILRAMIGSPRVLLADEPTGNLDNATATHVFKELLTLIKAANIATLIATHDEQLAAQMDRVIRLKNGKIV
jgi:ABC-type antimicrobial peptide transport system, ATPase component